MKVNILSNKIRWFGKYSGYECLPNYYPNNLITSLYSAKFNTFNRLIGRIFRLINKWKFVSSEEVLSELRFLKKIEKSSVSHILYLDAHIHLLDKFEVVEKSLIGTIHLPISFWSANKLKMLSKIDNVIILYNEDVKKFGQYISPEKIHVIKHGADVNFFAPGSPDKINKNKVLFVGHYLRNFDMFYNVYKQIYSSISPCIEYHFVIPSAFRMHPILEQLRQSKNIFFYENLTDEELLAHYQDSYLLLMPMTDSGASTAIVQALTTGLPIVTTDVGGIRSYGGADIFPVIKQNDVLGMVELFNKYYQNEEYRVEISVKEREYSLRYLNWEIIADEHINLYNKVLTKI